MTSSEFAQRVQEYIAQGLEEELAWSTAVDDEFYEGVDAVEAMLNQQADREFQ